MNTTCKQILSDFPTLLTAIHGNADCEIRDVTPCKKGLAGTLVFVPHPKELEAALMGPAAAIAIPANMWRPELEKYIQQKTFLLSTNIGLAMALVIDKYFNPKNYETDRTQRIHPSAVIDPTSMVHPSCYIDAHAVIGKHVTIGEGTWVGANTTIQDHVKIGHNCRIYPHVFIGRNTEIGNDCEIQPNSTIASEGFGFAHDRTGKHYRIPQRGRVVLEDRVEIGANCGIDRATFDETRIGEGTKMDNFCHIAHNCSIGKDGIITAGIILAGSTSIGNNFLTGGGVRITGHIKLADNVQLASLSAVTKSIEKGGAYGGHPVQPLKDYLRSTSSLPFLPKMRSDIKRLLKQVGLPSREDDESHG